MISTSRYFNPVNLRQFVTEFDLAPRHAVSPIRHLPKPYVFENLAMLDPSRIRLVSRTLKHQLLDDLSFDINLATDEFSPGNFILRLSLKSKVPYSNLIDIPRVSGKILNELNSRSFRIIIRRAVALSFGLRAEPLGHSGRITRHTKISVPVSAEVGAEYLTTHRPELVALHISRNPDLVPDPRLSASVIRAAEELNLKSETQMLLINAQGSTLFATSRSDSAAPFYNNRFNRVIDLSEIALSMQQELLHRDITLLKSEEGHGSKNVPFERWIRYPQNVFHMSVSNQRVWTVLSDALRLSSLIDELTKIDKITHL